MLRKIHLLLSVWLLLLATGTAYGQTNFFASSIFHNKIVFNPSQAGTGGQGLRLNGVFSNPMNNSQAGLSKEYAATADLAISETAGAGLVMTRQNVGFINETLFNLCYAYGTQFKSGMKLRMGFAAGFKSTRIEETGNIKFQGDLNDPAVQAYNSAPPSFFSSFGLTVYSEKMELQLVLPNLTASLQNKSFVTDYIMMQSGLTYKLKVGGGKLLGPGSYAKVFAGANMFKTSGMVINGGLLVNANNLMSVDLLYATSGIMTVGVGIPVEDYAQINLNYSVGGLYAGTIYGGAGRAEIHFSYLLKKKAK